MEAEGLMTQKFDTISLSKCKSAIPVIAQWFCCQWPDWYGPEGPGNAIADLEEWADGDALPLARLALSSDGEPLGIAALKNEGLGEEYGLGTVPVCLLCADRPSPPRRWVGVGQGGRGGREGPWARGYLLHNRWRALIDRKGGLGEYRFDLTFRTRSADDLSAIPLMAQFHGIAAIRKRSFQWLKDGHIEREN